MPGFTAEECVVDIMDLSDIRMARLENLNALERGGEYHSEHNAMAGIPVSEHHKLPGT